jgi:hypothetical protein
MVAIFTNYLPNMKSTLGVLSSTPIYLLLCIASATNGCLFAQSFYLAATPVSVYKYNFKYTNYPEVFSYRKNSSSFLPGNESVCLGYKSRYHFFEFYYSHQYYNDFKNLLNEPLSDGYFADEYASNYGVRYRHTLAVLPIRVLRRSANVNLLGFAGVNYQHNTIGGNSNKTVYSAYFNGQLTSMVTSTYSRANKNNLLAHMGVELEIPLYKGLVLTSSYAYYLSLVRGHRYVTNTYTGHIDNEPVEGERVASGSGHNLSLGLRFYLPGANEEKVESLLKYYLHVEYFQFSNEGIVSTKTNYGSRDDVSFGLLVGLKKNNYVIETGIEALPSIVRFNTDGAGPIADGSSAERRLYVPVRYKRPLPVLFKDKAQRIELNPHVGMGFHIPINYDQTSSFLPNGGFLWDYQKTNPLAIGLESGIEVSLIAKRIGISVGGRYLLGLNETRQIKTVDSYGIPTGQYMSSYPTGLLTSISAKFFLGK